MNAEFIYHLLLVSNLKEFPLVLFKFLIDELDSHSKILCVKNRNTFLIGRLVKLYSITNEIDSKHTISIKLFSITLSLFTNLFMLT